MTVSTRIAAAFAGLLLTGLSSEVQAATVTYNFAGSAGGYFPTMTFLGTDGSSLLVSANTVSNDGVTVTPVTSTGLGIGQWSGGLGINSYNDNSHTVDGKGLNDLLVLAFASSVKIVSATFKYAGQILGSNDGFAFFADDADVDSSVANDMIFAQQDIGASGYPTYTGTYNFIDHGYNYTSQVFGIGAIWDGLVCTYYSCRTKFDSFKLYSVTVDTGPFEIPPQVPLPAGVILLLSGLTGLGFLNRFKSKAGA